MNWIFAGILLASITTAHADTLSFDDAAVGQPPPGWTAAVTGSGKSIWTVEADASAPSGTNVLKQSAEGTFPICMKDGTNFADGYVEVQFKAIAGNEDQAGGVIWRAKDKDNYYIARANALEDNVTIYHTINGRRVAFKSADVKVTPRQWHRLRVEFTGNTFAVVFDGQRVIDATDNSIAGAGQVGLWTKADSVTLFDDFGFGVR
ncbi:MAG: DUF1080 domain-containing protein [Rhodospirillaceae bacterium]|nr:DUF1080 domain-containing protein [Rhodospirillaceae bacterium]